MNVEACICSPRLVFQAGAVERHGFDGRSGMREDTPPLTEDPAAAARAGAIRLNENSDDGFAGAIAGVPDATTGSVAAPSADLPRAPDFDSGYFRSALGQFATGVTIITTRAAGRDGSPHLLGFTANSFNSVSLEPPLVLWSLARSATSLAAFLDISHYAINVLASDQIDLSRRFGSSSRRAATPIVVDRFEGIAWREGTRGAPILEGCCAWFECFNRSRYEEGDHVIFVGQVERCGFADREPLIYQAGDYHMTQPHPDR